MIPSVRHTICFSISFSNDLYNITTNSLLNIDIISSSRYPYIILRALLLNILSRNVIDTTTFQNIIMAKPLTT